MVVKMHYDWFFDMSTDTNKLQVIKITAGGRQAVRRLPQMFGAYKKVKMGSVQAYFRPSATLPVDPTGLSYDFGENRADPRDMFNPGLVRVTNGEDFLDPNVINGVDASTEAGRNVLEDLYNTLLMDRSWRKFPLQAGMRIRGFPKFWGVGNIKHLEFPDQVSNQVAYSSLSASTTGDFKKDDLLHGSARVDGIQTLFGPTAVTSGVSSDLGLFQTGQRIPMGWLPTTFSLTAEDGFNQYNSYSSGIAVPPETDCITIILPQAHKTKFFFRVYIREYWYFKDPVVMNLVDNPANVSNNDGSYNELLAVDHFANLQLNVPKTPITPYQWVNNISRVKLANDGSQKSYTNLNEPKGGQ